MMLVIALFTPVVPILKKTIKTSEQVKIQFRPFFERSNIWVSML